MRKFNISVNGKTYVVEVEEAEGGASAPVVAAAPVAQAPAPTAPAGGTAVNAPMPGLVLKLAVANGATVKKGDKIVVLEAMKMENDIVAPVAGVITFAVKTGDNVETGARLASIN
ncbi:MAG: biotin/lipoyl-binding protein [Clostridia bacterium]|nr:biotin/lipoyl-binding protein [Clostridia bacterium]